MLDVIDVLAERYGWAYEDVWHIPFCETIPLVKRAKKGKMEDFSMLLAIIHNPHQKSNKVKELPQKIEAVIKQLGRKEEDDRPQEDWAERLMNISSKVKRK